MNTYIVNLEPGKFTVYDNEGNYLIEIIGPMAGIWALRSAEACENIAWNEDDWFGRLLDRTMVGNAWARSPGSD